MVAGAEVVMPGRRELGAGLADDCQQDRQHAGNACDDGVRSRMTFSGCGYLLALDGAKPRHHTVRDDHLQASSARITSRSSFLFYFLRSIRKCARSFRVDAAAPYSFNSVKACSTRASALRRDSSIPKRAG